MYESMSSDNRTIYWDKRREHKNSMAVEATAWRVVDKGAEKVVVFFKRTLFLSC